jgi:hypothetical protein
MKNNQIISALTGVFVVCALLTLYFSVKYRSSLNHLNQAQAAASYVKSVEEPMMNALLNDTLEYSKKNPAVIPILQSLSNNVVHPPAVAAKPGAK